jgi:hypothetical protein
LRLLGTTPEPIVLEARGSLNSTSFWQTIGPISPSMEPMLWDTGTGSFRFYRALRPR